MSSGLSCVMLDQPISTVSSWVLPDTVTSQLPFTYHLDRLPSPGGPLTWRSHPLDHNSNQLRSGETSSLERPPPGSSLNWKPPETAFSSCCTLTHHSLFWGASPFLMDFKFFGGKDSIKIIFTDLLFCTSKKSI